LPAHRFRLQGLTTLLTVSSSTNLADLVSDRQRSWDSPFGAFSSGQAPRHSCRADPRAVGSCPRHPRRRRRPRTTPRLLGFVPAPSPLRLGQTVKPDHRRRLLWGSPFQGPLTARLVTTFAATPLTCLAVRPTVATRIACTLEYQSPNGSPDPLPDQDPL